MRYLFENLNISVYVDWADPPMQHPTDRDTAEALKDKIKKYDKMFFIAPDAAIHSEWCNWEIGYVDTQKYDTDKSNHPTPSWVFKYTISTLLLWQASLVVAEWHNEFKRWLKVSSKDFKKT